MSYFREHINRFILEPNEGGGLRQCQLGAIWALKSQFTIAKSDPASLISMPTGSGKTALMMAACFELQLGKVLIVVPTEILRRQIVEQFRSLRDLKKIKCLPDQQPPLNAFEVEHRMHSVDDWEGIFRSNDVVVALPESISPYYKNLTPIPQELIGAIFIDEAHHEPAPTWKALNEYYVNVPRIFLTATPFRRDRKRMQAKMIFHYPLETALDSGILRPVEFYGIDAGIAVGNTETALIEKAVEVFFTEKEQNPNVAILIRTDRIAEAEHLSEKYNEVGIHVDVIHSKRSSDVNTSIINKVRENELHGLVCVGLASEGLDIPNLKIAVLHATPRSTPYTIQFLGRISRQPLNQEGKAILIANRDEVRGEVSKLYKSDKAWEKLIPQLIDDQMRKARFFQSSSIDKYEFLMPEINIYFSALIYETPENFVFEENFDTEPSSGIKILHVEQQDIDSPLIIITSQDKPLEWANRSIFIKDVLDIHVYYFNLERKLLFELTTSENALHSFKNNLIKSALKRIPHGRLFKTLSEFDQSDYLMVGMRNSVMRGASQPSYKTVLGSSVQASVRASEGRIFSTGHVLLRVDKQNVWGIATRRGRVWSMKRGTVEEFKVWCDQLGDLINTGKEIPSLPGLSFLASTLPIENIQELPIAVIPSDIFFSSSFTIIQIDGYDPVSNCLPSIEPRTLENETGILHCKLVIEAHEFDLVMNFNAPQLWQIISDKNLRIRIDRNDNNVIDYNLVDYLNDYPPRLIMRDGGVVEGRNRTTPNRLIEALPDNIWKEKRWDNCNIRAERFVMDPPPNRLPVINKTIELIKEINNSENDILILDDGSHEVADLIWFQIEKKVIHFVHCKPSSKDKPGCRKKDCDVLFAQAMRSANWVFSAILLKRLLFRLQNVALLISGTMEAFEKICNNYKINDWTYNIILSQPGFKISDISKKDKANNNVYELAIPMYEMIQAHSAEFEIWGT